MKKAFQEGWGAVIAKTVSLDSSKVVNVTPRYAKMRSDSNHKEVRTAVTPSAHPRPRAAST